MVKLILVIITLLTVTGCRNDVLIDEALPTTIHFAISDRVSDDNWKNFITVKVNSDDIITNVVMNSIPQTAMATRRDLAQLADYEDAFGYNFYEQVSQLEATLMGLSRDELADTIQNASTSNRIDFDITDFAYLAALALNSDPVEIGVYIDGWYQSVSDFNDKGFQYFVNLFIYHGSIIAVHWNAINDEGILKFDPINAIAVDDEALEWGKQAHYVGQTLIARQDPMRFSFDEARLSTDIPNVTIEIESFVSLATQALAAGPLTRDLPERND